MADFGASSSLFCGFTMSEQMMLSPKVEALCRQASQEYDPKRLIELTKEINELLAEQEGAESSCEAKPETGPRPNDPHH